MAQPHRSNHVHCPIRRGFAAPIAALVVLATATGAAAEPLPEYLRDRGPGIATSMFGTYVEAHERLVYAFYEYTLNRDQEYKPAELGFGLDQDFRAKLTEHEFL